MPEQFGQRLKALRKAKHWSQRELAEEIGLSHSIITMYETGQRQPKLPTLRVIASALDTTPTYLLGCEATQHPVQLTLGQRIKILRTAQHLTLEQVGRWVGVGKSTVRKWEDGTISSIGHDKVIRLASALNTTPAYLLGCEEPEQEENRDDAPGTDIIPDQSAEGNPQPERTGCRYRRRSLRVQPASQGRNPHLAACMARSQPTNLQDSSPETFTRRHGIMISLNIQADTPEELAAVLKTLGGVFTAAAPAADDAPISTEPVTAMERPADPETTKEQPAEEAPSAAPAEQEPHALPEEQPTTTPEQPKEPAATMEAARAALNELRQKKGAAAVRDLLKKHKVQSFIDLKITEYPTIIKEAKEYE